MNFKKFLILVILTSSSFLVNSEEYKFIPEVDAFIQPLNGDRYSILDYKSLEVGKEYNLIITSYVRDASKKKSKNSSIECMVSFLSPLVVDVEATDYSTATISDDNLKLWKLAFPIFPEARDASDRRTYTFKFIPRTPGEQDIKILYGSEIDEFYTKVYKLQVNGISSKNFKDNYSFVPEALKEILLTNKSHSEKKLEFSTNLSWEWFFSSDFSALIILSDEKNNEYEYPLYVDKSFYSKINKGNLRNYSLPFTTGEVDIAWKKLGLSFKCLRLNHAVYPTEIYYDVQLSSNKTQKNLEPQFSMFDEELIQLAEVVEEGEREKILTKVAGATSSAASAVGSFSTKTFNSAKTGIKNILTKKKKNNNE